MSAPAWTSARKPRTVVATVPTDATVKSGSLVSDKPLPEILFCVRDYDRFHLFRTEAQVHVFLAENPARGFARVVTQWHEVKTS